MKNLRLLFLFVAIVFVLSGCRQETNNNQQEQSEKFSVDFNSMGGSFISHLEIDKNSTIDLIEPNKKGYTFAGWYTSSDYSKEFTSTTPVTSNITLYAKWEINEYTVDLNSNGGQLEKSKIIKQFDNVINLPTPIKEGYSFKGWFEDNNLSIEFISAKMPANNITLYAKWEVNEYSIDLNPNGGQLEKSTIIKQYNDPLSLPIPIKDGYNFKGWYEDSHLSIEFLSTKMPSKNIALYAKWEPQYYTVTFITNSSDQIQPQEVKFGVNATNLPIPNRDGYNFEGWYLDENHTQVFSRMPSSDVTLYAKWTIKIENKGDLLKVVDQLTTSSYKSLDKYIDIPNIQDYYRIILHNGDTL